MPITPGDFTASQLATAIVEADSMWNNDMVRNDYVANVDIWTALKAEQNANVSILEDGEKDRDVKVHWINACGEAAVNCDGDDCDLAGNELGTDSETYSLSECKQWKFTVDEMKFRTNDYTMEQVVARGMLKADKILSESIASVAMARIESWKGTNAVPDSIGTWNALTSETDIASADWNQALFAYLYRVGLQNQLSNPFILSGSNMFEDSILAMMNNANSDGKGTAALHKLIRTYYDLFNVDPAVSPDLKTYLINRGAIAFASKNYYGATPTNYIGAGQQRYSVASRNLPGVRFDVHYTNRCSSETMFHDFKFKVKFDYFLNPKGCDANATGVLAFNRT